ncbi:uncharacterized protein LOC124657507 [Lolium rigidum]|uniref:uncharacterized protein LOC124657507 n=1 Tax=Lolium rigidum TaxID=89674 RepID=UPI001F5CCCEA|nr:uncharacterized protein LOC124657507 [Lolium rigidum]
MGTPAKEVAKEGTAAAVPQMKLLVDKRSRRVLYAEARKDAVDFLIGLLRVPAGLAARVIAHAAAENADDALAVPGSLGTLYAGARALDDAFFVSATPGRDAILCPALPSAALKLLLGGDASALLAPAPSPPPPPPPPPPPKRFFRCAGPYGTSCRGNPTSVTDVAGLPCPVCRQPMTVEMRWSPGDAHGKLAQAAAQEAAAMAKEATTDVGVGYVKEVVSYLVMDDLTVEPMSTISAIMLLKKFKVADCSALEELTVDLGHKEAVLLLKAALESTTALTDVFCGGVSIDRLE